MRSTMPATPPRRTLIPHSSVSSRWMAPAVVSPSSTRPPGSVHLPAEGWPPRRTSNTRRRCSTTAPTRRRGCWEYSGLGGGSSRPHEQGVGSVPVADERLDLRRLRGRQPAGPEREAVLCLERSAQRRRDVLELRPPAERRLQRRQRGEWFAGGRKDGAQTRLVHAEEDRPVLEEVLALPPLGAADHFLAGDLELVAARPPEAEPGRPAFRVGDGDDVHRSPERARAPAHR